MIHVDPRHLIALNKSSRFCPLCELLIAHQDELEAQLAYVFTRLAPDAVGNDYLVLGTMDRADWREGVEHPGTVDERRSVMHDFKKVLKFEPAGGWGRW